MPPLAHANSSHFWQQEWPKRWDGFLSKLLIAYGKYHAITLTMRIYEALSAKMFDENVVDKLTIDTYNSTLCREKMGQHLSTREMVSECWYSNLIAYLADYSVHQIILLFGYFVYVRDQQRRLKSSNNANAAENSENALHPGSMVLSFTKKVCLNVRVP